VKLIDWIAIIGAFAWTPHLVGLIRYYLSKPEIRIITQNVVELGFTTLGPIFNLRMAFSVKNKDLVISDIKIRLIHESGEERFFDWQGITQQMGKMTMPDATAMPFEKEHSVLAIKLNLKDIEERFIKFQDPNFLAEQREYFQKALKKMTYLKNENKYDSETFLREEEMTELYNFNRRAFPWKIGKYKVCIQVQSPEKFTIVDNEMLFTLLPLHIEQLEENKELLEEDYRNIIAPNQDELSKRNWKWVSPTLVKN